MSREPKRPTSIGRRALFLVLVLLLNYLAIETLSLVLYGLRYRSLISFSDLGRRRATLAGSGPRGAAGVEYRPGGVLAPKVIHPYLGFIYPPGAGVGNLVDSGPFSPDKCSLNSHGILGGEDFREQGPERVNVLITGGSVANQFYCLAGHRLATLLGQIPRYAGKQIRVFAFAYEGFKQPQQLMSLAYFLALGGQARLLINLDGYNEVDGALTLHQRRMHPTYPEGWEANFASLRDPREVAAIGRVFVYRDLRRSLAGAAQAVSFSVTANLLWRLVDDHLVGRIRQQNLALKRRPAGEWAHDFHRDGPLVELTEEAVIESYAQLWSDTSLAMADLAGGRDMDYFHFLQPNQWDQGSKPLSAEERAKMGGTGARLKSVTRGYKLMRKLGPRLARRGPRAHFVDLSPIFKEHPDTLYIDDCCHLNHEGNRLMAEQMARQIQAALARLREAEGG